MDYGTALEKLHSLTSFGIRPGLSRVRELLCRLGWPELDRSVRYVHIAGTNGKGSCGAMLESILRAAGVKTGFFSSPHLLHHCERYRINGRPLSEADFARLFTLVWEKIGDMERAGSELPTEFEAVTALSLLAFQEAGVEWAVMECGLGGLYDSTNVIDAELALITNVGWDHMDYLGHTIEEIASQKAGVIHEGQTVVTAAEEPALSVIAKRARECGDRLLVASRDFEAAVRGFDFSDRGFVLNVDCHDRSYYGLELPLLGFHQVVNAACSIQSAELLGLPEAAIREGLAHVCWPCRLEVVSRDPFVVIDGAHNEPGMQALAQAMELYWSDRRICAVVGMLDDKQREQALSHILPYISEAVVTRPGYLSRSGNWAAVADTVTAAGKPCRCIEDSRDAYAAALNSDCDMILICGSLYLAADLRGLFPLADFLKRGE